MNLTTRKTSACTLDTLERELKDALRAHAVQYGLDDVESNILMCCETISVLHQRGLFGGIRTTLSAVYPPLSSWSSTPKEIKMTLVQKAINGREYYADRNVYYTFHEVKDASDTLWSFAGLDLGITNKTGFPSQETKASTDLAGIGPLDPTKFLLLRNGNATPEPYLTNGSSNLHPNDIIFWFLKAGDCSQGSGREKRII